ncbi:hypothetical protein A3860_12105 [Niastella vici]|uniref:Uncharacterized protein n=1 Tax=Niastella vici TaxID=1703345 RepID=A0A1V9G6Q6_9BACT|nr:hypothetical protein A3860_12105 [Niastella vici]
MTQRAGDLLWFYGIRLFTFTNTIYGVDPGTNVLQSIKMNNKDYMTFTNGFDVKGILSSVSYPLSNVVGTYSITTQYKYRQ